MTTLPFRLLPLEEGQVGLAAATDDVRGLVVLDANGHRVGEVEDLIVDEAERRARLLVRAEDADSTIERGDYAAIYASYGCTPFWEATYSNPYFHDRQW